MTRRFTLLLCFVMALVAAALLLPGNARKKTGSESLPKASEFATLLARHYSYLLEEASRAALLEIDREIRWLTPPKPLIVRPGTGTEAPEPPDLPKRLHELLEGSPNVVRVAIPDKFSPVVRHEPVQLPGDGGAILLRVEAGKGDIHWSISRHDLAQDPGDRRPSDPLPIVTPVSPTGVTWGLLQVRNVPQGKSTVLVDLKYSGDRTERLPLDLTTPEPGRLQVTIESDDDSGPTPSMVRLIWKTTGHDRKPGNALDLSGQFEDQGYPQGSTTGRRVAHLPGELRGPYWCVPGPFDMTVPPGEWEITIRRGPEHVPVFDTVAVRSGEVVTKTYRPRRWIDMPELGWYSGDAHVHSRLMNDLEAEQLMTWAAAEDIHVANILRMGDTYRTWFEQRGFGKSYRVLGNRRALVPGQEDPRTHAELGHTIALNLQEAVRNVDSYFLYDTMFDAVHRQGGLCGYAHVILKRARVTRDMSMNVPKGKTDFVEIMQLGYLGTDIYYDFLNLGFQMTAAAGSDVPWGGTMGEVRMYAYLGDQDFRADAWFEAVKRGRTFVTNGPMIDFQVDDAVPGDQIVLRRNRPLRVKARVRGDGGRMMPVRLEIVEHGEVIRSAESTGEGRELRLDFQVGGGTGSWIAARAIGSDGSSAHTTPVYVIREPLRFWKLDVVEELIDRRLGDLDQVQEIVERARQLTRQNNAPNRSAHLLAAQASALLERVAEARDSYEELRRVAHKELEIRKTVSP